MIPKTIVHLLSGGLDSVTMLHELVGEGQKVHCVLIDYKQQHVQELRWAKYHCEKLGVLYTLLEIPQLQGSELTDGQGGVVVPNRNAIFLSLAVNVAVAAKADLVTFAANKDDAEMFPDCRPEFVLAFNAMLAAAEIKVQVCVPYIDKSKAWIGGMAQNMGIKASEIWTCYRGGEKPCGECPACQKLKSAFLHENTDSIKITKDIGDARNYWRNIGAHLDDLK